MKIYWPRVMLWVSTILCLSISGWDIDNCNRRQYRTELIEQENLVLEMTHAGIMVRNSNKNYIQPAWYCATTNEATAEAIVRALTDPRVVEAWRK